MAGHLEQAAAALNGAADQVPLEIVLGAEQQLNTVAQYTQEAGGDLGQRLTHETLAAQSHVREMAAMLSNLRQSIQSGAQQVLASGG